VLTRLSEAASQDLFVFEGLKRFRRLVQQAQLLAARYDAVVANPPYMGNRGGMNTLIKKFAKEYFFEAKSDLFACFIQRSFTMAKHGGRIGMVTMQSWMFLSSYQRMRKRMLQERTITTLAQIGYNSFPSLNSKVAQATAFSIENRRIPNALGVFIDLNSAPQSADKSQVFLARDPANRFDLTGEEFRKIPGSPLAYWVSRQVRACFQDGSRLDNHVQTAVGLFTCDNERFLRNWHEVSILRVGFGLEDRVRAAESGFRFFPIQKGGGFRKWYGLNDLLVQFDRDGHDIRKHREQAGQSYSLPGEDYYFRKGITWSGLTSGLNSFRQVGKGHIFESNKGQMLFSESEESILGFLNSCVARVFLQLINPTLSIQSGEIRKLPLIQPEGTITRNTVCRLVKSQEVDDNSFESSWGFRTSPLLSREWQLNGAGKNQLSTEHSSLAGSFARWLNHNRASIAEVQRLEEENNRLFIDAYGLQDELTPEVPIEQITLTVNPAYRYGKKLSDDEWSVEEGFPEELETRFREDTMQELVSYAIGCAMGRYSLDEPGLIYAHSGNVGFDASRYSTFPADGDGIIPITDTDWFDDDATHRVVEFISVAWDKAHLEANLKFLADNLSPKKGEASRDTLRRYLADKFFKDHLQTYKKRPIYWCFSSGKQKAFQCLVYLHRYHEGTLARMRMEYVVPLQSKMAARIDTLADDIQAASTSAQAKRLQKERDKLTKQLDELRRYDEQLRHYADQRIALDLDDGVKVNYGKFGNLLAEVKAVTGTAAD